MVDTMSEKAALWEKVKSASRVGIAGHVRPDGDCIGACMALYNYIRDNYSCEAEVFAESVPESFRFLKRSEDINTEYPARDRFDLFIALDTGDKDRLGEAAAYFEAASDTFVIDHHYTNTGFGNVNVIDAKAAATCEILFDFFEPDKLSKGPAEALYLGIVHDTGVFKHSNTTRKTMETAGRLLEYGVNTSQIIDGTFYEKTYLQNQILGRCLTESILAMDGQVIISYVTLKTQDFYGLVPSDTDGIIDQLRITKGVEVALLLKEVKPREWKVSLRSNEIVDVGQISVIYNGGGHVRAAGCTMFGSLYDVINSLTKCIEAQLVAKRN